MGAVIKFPRRGRSRKAPATMPDASAIVVILPVVRIERAANKSAAAKPAPARKRRKRVAPALPSPACG